MSLFFFLITSFIYSSEEHLVVVVVLKAFANKGGMVSFLFATQVSFYA